MPGPPLISTIQQVACPSVRKGSLRKDDESMHATPLCAEILVVEDDAAIRNSLCDLLADEGYTVAAVPHGGAALAYLQQDHSHPRLILLDLLMPVMNGYEFRRAQQQDAQLAQIPVVVLSAQNLSEREADGMELAFYLRKPLALPPLLTIVESYCRSAEGA